MKKTLRYLLCTAIIISLAACRSKHFIYLEDMPLDMTIPISYKHEPRIKPGDRLAIHVSCTKQELAVPFNSTSYTVSADAQTKAADPSAPNGYLVDDDGFINFPILGRLQVGGLTMPQISDYIRGLLVEGRHVPDAVVETRITNFTIYGLGALSPGKLLVPDGKINVLQAVAQMGDLQGRAKYEKVRVIREEDGQRMEFDLDMTSAWVFESPAFYLHQNDIVYAEPKRRSNDAGSKTMIWVSLLSVLTSITYTLTLIFKR